VLITSPGTAALATIASIVASAPARVSPAVPANPPGQLQLSDEVAVTQWSTAVARGGAYTAPSSHSHRVGRLRFTTEDGFPEVYVLLSSFRDAHGTTWVRVRLPQRPNGTTGWVVRAALGDFRVVHTTVVVNRRTLRLTLYDGGRGKIFQAPVGVGKASTPTPAGRFWIREKFRVHGKPLYGTRAMGTAAYSSTLTDWPGGGVIGLHGTSEPGLIPGRPSHGCVRLKNRDIERLYALTPVGTPVLIT
jgi:lipoprotein-anchoring transpeptidase ErfK/SrfK